MSDPTEGDVISIPAGTQFPSYLGASGGLFNTYVTTEDVTYTYMSGAWEKKIDWVSYGGYGIRAPYWRSTLDVEY